MPRDRLLRGVSWCVWGDAANGSRCWWQRGPFGVAKRWPSGGRLRRSQLGLRGPGVPDRDPDTRGRGINHLELSTLATVLDVAMTEPTQEPKSAAELDQDRRTSMAAERTWLAATAGALAVGRFAPKLLDVAPGPYVVLGCGYGALAISLAIFGAHRQRQLERAIRTGAQAPLSFRVVALFTAGGVALALLTLVLVISES